MSTYQPGACCATIEIVPYSRWHHQNRFLETPGVTLESPNDMNQPKRWNRKRLAKAALLAVLIPLGLFVLDLVLLCHPGIFFRYAFSQGWITIYSEKPIPPLARDVLTDAEKRLEKSVLFRGKQIDNLRR